MHDWKEQTGKDNGGVIFEFYRFYLVEDSISFDLLVACESSGFLN